MTPAAAGAIVALVPCHADPHAAVVVERCLAHVDEVVVLGDDAPPAVRAALDALAGPRTTVVHRRGRRGKGTTLADGTRELLARPRPPQIILTIDADGQHPPHRIPAFIRATRAAEIVIGDRTGDLSAMPRVRRLGNRSISVLLSLLTGRSMPDTQCGMRAFRSSALRRAPLREGGFEAETEHLARAAAAGLRIAWVAIPAIYDGETSDFRPLRDSVRILHAALAATRDRRRGSRRVRRLRRTWSDPTRSAVRSWRPSGGARSARDRA